MIYDTLAHLSLYEQALPLLTEGLRFLQNASADIAPGRHLLSAGNYANVDLYTTRKVNPLGYEAHRKYIDIQFLLSGEEEVLIRNVDELDCTSPYDPDRDVAFFRHAEPTARVKLGKGAFVVLFPQDAHEPQICIDTPSPVKKIVVKIAIDNLQDTIR